MTIVRGVGILKTVGGTSIHGPGDISIVNAIKYTETLPSTFSYTILQSTHGLTKVSGINLFNLSGEDISVEYSIISNDVTITSNINLINHIVEIY